MGGRGPGHGLPAGVLTKALYKSGAIDCTPGQTPTVHLEVCPLGPVNATAEEYKAAEEALVRWVASHFYQLGEIELPE